MANLNVIYTRDGIFAFPQADHSRYALKKHPEVQVIKYREL